MHHTVFIRLYDGLVALFPSLRIGQNHLETDVGVGWQVSHQVAWCWEEKEMKETSLYYNTTRYTILKPLISILK